MKEYLVKDKQTGFYYVDINPAHYDDSVEIPEGAVKFFVNNEGKAHFVSLSGQFMADYDIKNGEGYWYDPAVTMEYYQSVMGGTLVWSRHTQPEELPFFDDTISYDDSVVNMDTAVGYDLDNLGKQLGAMPRNEGQSCDSYRKHVKDIASFKNRGIVFSDTDSTAQVPKQHSHYFIDVSDVDEIDFYEIAKRYNVTDPCVQHILKKCLAIGNRGHKSLHTDMKDIHDTAVRMLAMHGIV